MKKYYKKKRDAVNKKNREAKRKLRIKVINTYGGKCKRCGFKDFRALQIDHINGGGTKERKTKSIIQLLYEIVRKNYPKDYQVLCANCNCIKRFENNE